MSMFKWWCAATFFVFISIAEVQAGDVSHADVFKILKPQDESVYENFKRTIISKNAKDLIPAKSPEQKYYKADDLIGSFGRNEISATDIFKNAKIRIKGKAVEIGVNAFNDGFIRVGGEFQYVVMAVNRNDELIKKMSKGDVIDMVCTVDKYSLHTVYLKDCVPASEVTSIIAKNRLEGIAFNTPDTITAASIAIIYKINEAKFNKGCKAQGKGCDTVMDSVFSDAKLLDMRDDFAKKNGIYEWMKSLPQVQE